MVNDRPGDGADPFGYDPASLGDRQEPGRYDDYRLLVCERIEAGRDTPESRRFEQPLEER